MTWKATIFLNLKDKKMWWIMSTNNETAVQTKSEIYSMSFDQTVLIT